MIAILIYRWKLFGKPKPKLPKIMSTSISKIKLIARAILILDLLLVGVWLYLAFATDSQISAWRTLESRDQQSNSSDAMVLKRYLDETKVERETLGQLVIKGEAVTGFIDRLETLARASQVQLKIDQAVPTGGQGLTLKLTASGDFAHVYRFVEILDTLPEPLAIRQVDLSSSSASADLPGVSGRNTWRADIGAVLLSYQN